MEVEGYWGKTFLQQAGEVFGGPHPQKITESFVNGVWNAILSHYFPFPDYVIAPEYWTERGSRVDLVVYRRRDGKVVLVYEGKAKLETETEHIEGFAQATRYIQSINDENGKLVFGILAGGSKFIILQFDGVQYRRMVQGITPDDRFDIFFDLAGTRNFSAPHQTIKLMTDIYMKP